jgi:hypothetical protein
MLPAFTAGTSHALPVGQSMGIPGWHTRALLGHAVEESQVIFVMK